MTADLRAAILARCDQLERLACEATRWIMADEDHELSRDAMGVVRDRVGFVQAGGEVPLSGFRWETRSFGTTVAPHLAAWNPPAVLDLVAGARQMCEIHRPDERDWAEGFDDPDCQRAPGPACVGCGPNWQEEWAETVESCPMLRLTAKMIGAMVDG